MTWLMRRLGTENLESSRKRKRCIAIGVWPDTIREVFLGVVIRLAYQDPRMMNFWKAQQDLQSGRKHFNCLTESQRIRPLNAPPITESSAGRIW